MLVMCCEEFENLGCFGSCLDEFETKLIADETGEWILEYEFDGVINKIKKQWKSNKINKMRYRKFKLEIKQSIFKP